MKVIRFNWRWLRTTTLRLTAIGIVLLLLQLGLLQLLHPAQLLAAEFLPSSQYASTLQAPFNQFSYYPITPAPPSASYRPVGDWIGRLILPTVEQYQQQDSQETDWVWFEVQIAPTEANALIGKTVRLAWSQKPLVQAYVKTASRDVQFTPDVEASWLAGNIHPTRLNHRTQVGPLQSLAGGRPYDDVVVDLRGAVQVESAPVLRPVPVLRIDREPIQQTGRFVGLVKFLAAAPPPATHTLPQSCPGAKPCTSDWMRVRHYNPMTRQFDGVEEVIYIPQQPPDWIGVYNMTTRDLVKSPAGAAGWYIYGAQNAAGVFTVQALEPRTLFQLRPQQIIAGLHQGLQYINYQNWQDTPARKGTIQTVLVDPTAKTLEAAQAEMNQAFPVGTRALVMHSFGGRGGTQPTKETSVLGTYAGHFAFGFADVVLDPFTSEPRLNVTYLQVYGKNVEGILAGGNTWANYMGNLQRGWMGTRPTSDVVIRLDAITEDYDFGGIQFSVFDELLGELSLAGARYRIGDGTGGATVTPATSCVQDASQALFTTLRRTQEKIRANPNIEAWLEAHPDDPTTQRFQKLVQLGQDLTDQLIPFGIVRSDWAQNADILTGVRSNKELISNDDLGLKNIRAMLLSWRTALPRQAYDELAMLLLRYDSKLWFLRTNQIGGVDPGIAPIAPTLLMGEWTVPFTQVPLLSFLVNRIFGGLTLPDLADWLKTLGMLLLFGTIASTVGFSQGLRWQPRQASWYRQVGSVLRLFVPALLEELGFRVLFLPYPTSWLPNLIWWSWALLGLGLFVSYHALSRARHNVDPTFLSLVTLLGLACTIVYQFTGSLWTITLIHWIVTSIWLLLLDEKQSRYPKPSQPMQPN